MHAKENSSITFHKLHGCGNDFIVVDNRKLKVARKQMPLWAAALCRRAFGIGADGMFFLNAPPSKGGVDYVWDFYNPDGSRAEMCGNGARCAAWIALELGFAPPEHTIGTDAGPVTARIDLEKGTVKVRLTEPGKLALNVELSVNDRSLTVHSVNTGVPHAVVVVDNVEAEDIVRTGAALRHHAHFQPEGTNVNFIEILTTERFRIRTYERGVEMETFACGTGACASLIVGHALGLLVQSAKVHTYGGDVLRVSTEDGWLYLEGPARKVYTGTFRLGDFNLKVR